MNRGNLIEHIYSKKDIKYFIEENKFFNGGILSSSDFEKGKKIKKNRPKYIRMDFELDNNYRIVLQDNNDIEFPEYSAILIKNQIRICRLDYHDAHRRNCKKEIFDNIIANELHLHIYCQDCINEKLKYDSFVLNISENKIWSLSFDCFASLFFKIINLNNNIKCEKGLFDE